MTREKVMLWAGYSEASTDVTPENLLKAVTSQYELLAEECSWAPDYEVRVVDEGVNSEGMTFIRTEVWGHRLGDEA